MTGQDVLLCWWPAASTFQRIIILEILFADACARIEAVDLDSTWGRAVWLEACPLPHYFTPEYLGVAR